MGRQEPKLLWPARGTKTDRSLPVTGKLDSITLAALASLRGREKALKRVRQLLLRMRSMPGATVDARTGRPAMLAATMLVSIALSTLSRAGSACLRLALDPRSTCIRGLPQQRKLIWVGTAASGVIVSRDGGQTCSRLRECRRSAVNTIVQDVQAPDHVYVGTKQAFYPPRWRSEWNRRGGNIPFGDSPVS